MPNNKYTDEEKEFIRDHFHNPYDGTLFSHYFYQKFDEHLTDEKNEDFYKENEKLFGDVHAVQYINSIKVTGDLPHIKTCQQYILDPFELDDGTMTRPQLVYLRNQYKSTMRDPSIREPSFYPIGGGFYFPFWENEDSGGIQFEKIEKPNS